MDKASKTITISIDQLCVGLYVHLDVGWLSHSFSRNSFSIKNHQQIKEIRQLGLTHIRIEPALCLCAPLPLPADLPQQPLEPEPSSPEELAAIKEKKHRVEKLIAERQAISRCEKEYQKAANTVKHITRTLFSQPKQAYQEADQLAQDMLHSLLSEKDIAIHVMNDKIAGEEAYYHSLNVTVLAMMLGKELKLPATDIRLLGIGCLLHDIGKIDIPDRIVNKKTALTTAEQHFLEMHCHYGIKIAEKIGLSKDITDIIQQHHEYADGSGYPAHLTADKTSLLAQLVCLINAYDNHCNHPKPADSMTPYEALAYMFAHQKKLFNLNMLTTFIRCMGVYPPGTLVKLSDGSLGMVVSVNAGKPLRPTVLIYDAEIPKEEAIIIDLCDEPGVDVSASLRPAQLEPHVYAYLSPRMRMAYYLGANK